jgi:hypothetical protein
MKETKIKRFYENSELNISDVSDSKFIEFGIWIQNRVFATYQVGGPHEGMWHVHYPEFGYITSEELIQYWKIDTQ